MEIHPQRAPGDGIRASARVWEDAGEIDYRTSTRDGKPAVEFSWEGGDDADGTP